MSPERTMHSDSWWIALNCIQAEILRRAMRGGSVVDELLAERRDEASHD